MPLAYLIPLPVLVLESPVGYFSGQRLALSINPTDGQSLIVDTLDTSSPWQRWGIDQISDRNFALWHGTGALLIADMSSGALSLRPNGYDALASRTHYATDEIWNLADSTANTLQQLAAGIANTVADTFRQFFAGETRAYIPGFAIRPNFNYNRNLNILGDGPWQAGRTVAAWEGWGGGDPNELWIPNFPDG
jgi:hypothetical protein